MEGSRAGSSKSFWTVSVEDLVTNWMMYGNDGIYARFRFDWRFVSAPGQNPDVREQVLTSSDP
jgi:hypothetical protein